MIRELVPYRDFERDEVFACITGLIKSQGRIDPSSRAESASWYCDCVSKMAAAAEKAGIAGNVWHSWLAMLLAENENPFSLAQEGRAPLVGTMRVLAMQDFETIFEYLHFDFSELERELGVDVMARMGDFSPLPAGEVAFGRIPGKVIGPLASQISNAQSPEEIFDAVTGFYRRHGVGQFGLYSGFRWDSQSRSLVPAVPLDDVVFSNIIGYEDQKKLAEEMKRKHEQGSMQLQGEVQELVSHQDNRRQFQHGEKTGIHHANNEVGHGEYNGNRLEVLDCRSFLVLR